jgi:hypothetical protein
MTTIRTPGGRRGQTAPALLLALAVLLLAACGSSDRLTGGSPSPSGAPSTSAPKPAPPLVTLTGTVGPGVEAGCLVLTAGDRVYSLQGGPEVRALTTGTVTVHGYELKGVLSICQQGTPFRVVRLGTD